MVGEEEGFRGLMEEKEGFGTGGGVDVEEVRGVGNEVEGERGFRRRRGGSQDQLLDRFGVDIGQIKFNFDSNRSWISRDSDLWA